jgi:hypothetical protein
MRLERDCEADHSGIGAGTRVLRTYINNAVFWSILAGQSGSGLVLRGNASLNVQADTLATHARVGNVQYSFATGNQRATVDADFSDDWTAAIYLTSAAETAVAIATATWVGGVATYNTSAVHTLAVGDKTTIAGVDLAGYNGVVIVASIVDTDTFTVAMASDPGGSGTGGTSSRISNMRSQSYVLELVG